jgi:hypothetical protein
VNGRKLKNRSLLAGIVVSGLTLLAWTGQWFTLRLAASGAGRPTLAVTGDAAAPGLIALALAGLALVAALAIAGPVFRAVLGVLQAVIGFAVALSSILEGRDGGDRGERHGIGRGARGVRVPDRVAVDLRRRRSRNDRPRHCRAREFTALAGIVAALPARAIRTDRAGSQPRVRLGHVERRHRSDLTLDFSLSTHKGDL